MMKPSTAGTGAANDKQERIHDDQPYLIHAMENNEGKAIQEDIIDNLVKQHTALEKRMMQMDKTPIPDYANALTAIRKTLEELKTSIESQALVDTLIGINSKLDKPAKPESRQIRLLLFPETNKGQYYKIVFGRLIPWGLGFVIATYSFIIGYRAIEIYRYNKVVSQSMHYERAWLYLRQHSKKKTLGAMDEAYNKTNGRYLY